MQTISLCMIVKDEEGVLARCLKSVSGAVDEIVIVDTGSSDRTREIAREMGAKVFEFVWIDDFSAARNASFSYATMDYILWLDADDILPGDQCKKLAALKNGMDGSVDAYMLPYCLSFDENGQPTFNYYRERLLKRAAGFVWEGAVHECIAPRGKISYVDIRIYHKKMRPSESDRNLRIYEGLLRGGRILNPREKFYYGSELYFHRRYEEADRILGEFLDGGGGFVENNITACRYRYVCRRRMGETFRALEALAVSFEWGTPRAEVLCDFGGYFLERQRCEEAAYYYELALKCERGDMGGGFVEMDCYDFIPYLQLTVCYDRMGQKRRAANCNERALRIKPNNEIALGNRAYFLANPN